MAIISVSALLLLITGCEYEEDYYDHVPAPGKGSIIIDNNTSQDINFYVDGERVSEIGDYRERIFDLEPGVRRVVLDEEDGDTTYREDVDVLDGRLTILKVWADIGVAEYIVEIDFE